MAKALRNNTDVAGHQVKLTMEETLVGEADAGRRCWTSAQTASEPHDREVSPLLGDIPQAVSGVVKS